MAAVESVRASRVGRVLVYGVFAAIAIAATVWLVRERTLVAGLAATDELAAIEQAEASLKIGPTPADWPARAFIPRAVVQSALSVLKTGQIIIPIGKLVDKHVDGYLHLNIESVEVEPSDGKIGARLAATAGYEPDRQSPWWGSAKADVIIVATLFPNSRSNKDGVLITNFRVVPDSIDLQVGWSFFSLRARGLFAALVAEETTIHLRDALEIPVPALAPSVPVDPTVKSSSFQPFGGDGGTKIVLAMNRPSQNLTVSLDNWLPTRSGIWLLGGKSGVVDLKAPKTVPTASELSKRRAGLAEKLLPFQRRDASLELTLPAGALTDLVDHLLSPSPLEIDVSTAETSGTVTDAIVLHNDKVLGNVGLQVRADGDNFAHGTVTMRPDKSSWSSQSGITIPLKIDASASIALDMHLATGVGGGLGRKVVLQSDASVSIPLQASFEKRTIPEGSAILLQPSIKCSPARIQVHAGTSPVISENWIIVSPIGLELDREIGGMKIAPGILVDGLPTVIPLPTSKDADGKLLPAEPAKAVVQLSPAFLGLSLTPVGVSMNEKSVTVLANVAAVPRDAKESDEEKDRRAKLHQAMADASPTVQCQPITDLKVIGGATEILDLYKEFMYVGESLKRHEKVAEDVLKALIEIDPKNTPENMEKFATDAIKAGTEDLKHVLDVVKNPPPIVKQVVDPVGSFCDHNPCPKF